MKLKNQIHPKYTYVKDGVFYFCRVIPKDLEAHYSRPRFVKSLRTKSRQKASFAARHNCSTQNDKTTPAYWSCRLPRYAKQLGLSGGGSFFW